MSRTTIFSPAVSRRRTTPPAAPAACSVCSDLLAHRSSGKNYPQTACRSFDSTYHSPLYAMILIADSSISRKSGIDNRFSHVFFEIRAIAECELITHFQVFWLFHHA
jgi:hypothetical protein